MIGVKSFTYKRKKKQSKNREKKQKKNLNTNQKSSVWEIRFKLFNYKWSETKRREELHGLKYQRLSEDLLILSQFASVYSYLLK